MIRTQVVLPLIAALLFCTQTVFAADNRAYDFHRIALGSSESSLVMIFPQFSCSADKTDSALHRCHAKLMLKDDPGVLKGYASKVDVHLVYRNDKLVNIRFPFYPAFYDMASTLFTQHYGPPDSTRSEEIKLKNGSLVTNTKTLWRNNNQSILFEKYTGSSEISDMLFSLKQ